MAGLEATVDDVEASEHEAIELARVLALAIDPTFAVEGPAVEHRVDHHVEGVPGYTETGRRVTIGSGPRRIELSEITRRSDDQLSPTESWHHVCVELAPGVGLRVEIAEGRLRVGAGAPRRRELSGLAAALEQRGIQVRWHVDYAPPTLPGAEEVPALLAALPAALRPPATPRALDDAEVRLGARLPPEVRALYACGDGGALAPSISLFSMVEAIAERERLGGPPDLARLPIVAAGPARLSVLLTAPVEGRVVSEHPSGPPTLLSVSVATLLEAIGRAVPGADGAGPEIPSWYAEHPRERTEDDAHAAHELASKHRVAPSSPAPGREPAPLGTTQLFALAAACTLARPDDMVVLVGLLEQPPFVHAAVRRLREGGVPAAEERLRWRASGLRWAAERARSAFATLGAPARVDSTREEDEGPRVLVTVDGAEHSILVDVPTLGRVSRDAVAAWATTELSRLAARATPRQ